MEDFDEIFLMIQNLKHELSMLNRPMNPFVEARSFNVEVKRKIFEIRENIIDFLQEKECDLKEELVELMDISIHSNDHEAQIENNKKLIFTHGKYQQVILLINEICNIFGHDGEKNGKYYHCEICGKIIHELEYTDYRDVNLQQIQINLANSFLSLDNEKRQRKIIELFPKVTYDPEDFDNEVIKRRTRVK